MNLLLERGSRIRTIFLAVLAVAVSAGAPALAKHARAASSSSSAQFSAATAAYDHHDYASALRLLAPLADRGYAPAQNNLGMMYATGQGVPLDYSTAAAMFRKAAEQGYALGQFDLGAMYGNGLGMPQDYIQAYKWFDLAARSASDSATLESASKNREGVATSMTPAQIAQAKKLADECLRSEFLMCN